MERYAAAGERCPICFNAKGLDPQSLVANASLGGTVQLWEWIGPRGRQLLQLLIEPVDNQLTT